MRSQGHDFLAEIGVTGVEDGLEIRVCETVERRIKLGDVFALGALERIKVGPAAADVAVGGNELLHSHELATQVGVGTGGHDHLGSALLGALGKCVDDGLVGNVASVGAVNGRDVLQGIEVAAPVVWHAARVLQVFFVHLFDVRGIAPEEIRVALVGNVDVRLAH